MLRFCLLSNPPPPQPPTLPSPTSLFLLYNWRYQAGYGIPDMPTLLIPARDSWFGSFSLSPTQFLKFCRNSWFFRHYTLKILKWHNSIVEILYLNLQSFMIFRFSAFVIFIPPRWHQILFSFFKPNLLINTK